MRYPVPETAPQGAQVAGVETRARFSSVTNPSIPFGAELGVMAIQAAPIVLYVYDVQRERSVFQNRSFAELLGHPPTEPVANDWRAHIHPDDEMKFPAHRERLKTIKPGESAFWEYRMRDAEGQWRWFLSRDNLLTHDDKGRPLLIVGSAFDISEQKTAEQHKELLADEMRHRAKNLASVVEAIGRLSRPKNQPAVDKFIDTFMGRLMTLLNTGSIVLSSAARTADLRDIVTSTLAPFLGEGLPQRIAVEGPAAVLSERTAASLALAIHELATNAVKYGALSTEAGSVVLRWKIAPGDGANTFVMEWIESGGPPVAPPNSEGFGGMVIRQSVAREQKGRVALDYLTQGLACRFEFEIR
jgi:PAS domain S-box-containing protein